MDKILREIIDQACGGDRLGRTENRPTHNVSETLARLEAAGDAMRYLDAKGRVAWKATPHLRDLVRNLELEARADLEDAD